MYFLLEKLDFHFYLSFPEGNSLVRFMFRLKSFSHAFMWSQPLTIPRVFSGHDRDDCMAHQESSHWHHVSHVCPYRSDEDSGVGTWEFLADFGLSKTAQPKILMISGSLVAVEEVIGSI